MNSVSLVIVSHSAQLANGVAELARQLTEGNVRIVAAGGTDSPEQPIGTSVEKISNAIAETYSDAGVLVLMDLGSAILSAEMALDFLPEEQRTNVLLCEAPLVEGAVAAAVQAKIGRSLAEAAAEARNGLAAKIAHLAPSSAPSMLTPPILTLPTLAAPPFEAPKTPPPADQHVIELMVANRLGLHARPAARFVQLCAQFDAEIRLQNVTTASDLVDARSINAVATLGVRQGHQLLITASGAQAVAALAALQQLAAENFGDETTDDARVGSDDRPSPPSPLISPTNLPTNTALAYIQRGTAGNPQEVETEAALTLLGVAASPGIVLGPARRLIIAEPEPSASLIERPAQEWERVLNAIERTRARLRQLFHTVALRTERHTADIFQAHLLILSDPMLHQAVQQIIWHEKLNGAAAWRRASDEIAKRYRALPDDYMRQRALDVEDVGRQVIAELLGVLLAPTIQAPGVLVVADLTPADTASLDPALVQGIVTAQGGATSHSAILARSLGIPAVVGLGETVLSIAEGTALMLDGAAGELWIEPTHALQEKYSQRQANERQRVTSAFARRNDLAISQDRRRIEVFANIGSLADARAALEAGAEGVGLFRSEFLFLDRRVAPDEDEQYAAYRAVATALGGQRPLVIRTLDVGGDKALPYLAMPQEANPFLGWRGLRLCLDRPEFFKVQLRAIARLAAEFPIKVMFPMVATVAEFRAARQLLQTAANEAAGNRPAQNERRSLPIETGAMVEIPAAALCAESLASEVDFFSIGTNDLTQYVLAAERGNARVAYLTDALHPAVLDLIQRTVTAAQRHGKWVGVCGELAGDTAAIPLLVGLGVSELSMAPPLIPLVKETIRSCHSQAARRLAESALRCEDAQSVRRLLSTGSREGE